MKQTDNTTNEHSKHFNTNENNLNDDIKIIEELGADKMQIEHVFLSVQAQKWIHVPKIQGTAAIKVHS